MKRERVLAWMLCLPLTVAVVGAFGVVTRAVADIVQAETTCRKKPADAFLKSALHPDGRTPTQDEIQEAARCDPEVQRRVTEERNDYEWKQLRDETTIVGDDPSIPGFAMDLLGTYLELNGVELPSRKTVEDRTFARREREIYLQLLRERAAAARNSPTAGPPSALELDRRSRCVELMNAAYVSGLHGQREVAKRLWNDSKDECGQMIQDAVDQLPSRPTEARSKAYFATALQQTQPRDALAGRAYDTSAPDAFETFMSVMPLVLPLLQRNTPGPVPASNTASRPGAARPSVSAPSSAPRQEPRFTPNLAPPCETRYGRYPDGTPMPYLVCPK